MVYVYVYTCTSAYGNGSYLFTMILSAIGSQKVSCLCLLHLFAAFDTIALNIIITRLSSLFGIHGSSRHTYHLAPCVLTATRLFHTSSSIVVFPRLCCLLFIVYTIPLSTLIFLFLNHQEGHRVRAPVNAQRYKLIALFV